MFSKYTKIALIIFTVTFYLSSLSIVKAESAKSSNYRFDESSIGSGGLIESSSENYRVSDATSDLVVGNSASNNYQINAGSKTTNDPTLSFTINNALADFNNFTPTNPSTATTSFSVTNYTSYGYIVQIIGDTPTNGEHSIPAIKESDEPEINKEQFGINLVANTSPTSIGANPINGQFGHGAASDNYKTPNKYRYISGETIAMAPKSSGQTTYTISYLVNVANLTPGGKYTCKQTIIITGTY